MSQIVVPTKNRRKQGPKVRSGCITCKIRKVKCDETKPACERCIKWSGSCDGYSVVRTPKCTSLIPVGRPILPNIKPLCRSLDNSPFCNDLEYHAFQEFSQNTARHLTGFRESGIWSRVVLQATETDACIRHAVTAIGALNFKDWVKRDNEEARLEFAYREYDKAIVSLKTSAAEGKADIRMKLISCILFACFEAYHGNNETATGQVFSGVDLMEQYVKQRQQLKALMAEEGDVHQSISIPPPVDREIVETLMLFEIQSLSYYDGRDLAKHQERMNRLAVTVEKIPKEFTNPRQASSMLSRILLWGIHVRFSQNKEDIISSPISSANLPPLLGLRPCTTVYSKLARALNKYTKWEEAFKPLRTKARRSPGTPLFNEAALLQLHCLASYIWLASGSPIRSMYYRKYTRHLREIVDLATMLNAQQTEGSFSLDFRTVLPLMIVSANYRHIAIRREVIEIFCTRPTREGLWDSALLGKIMGWLADIEEEGVEGEEYVPDERIAEIVEIRQDSVKREVFVSCTQGEEGGDGVSHETTLSW